MNINHVIITGNLTRDPELRALPSGDSVCELRVAVNGRKKDAGGEWVDDPGYYNVSVWGKNAENCKQYLTKGSGVAIDGRLRWREWEKDGVKRQAVDILANIVQFLNSGTPGTTTKSDLPYEAPPQTAPAYNEDDIPF